MNLLSLASVRTSLVAAIVLAFCSQSFGDDITWTGAVNSAWENGGNWDDGVGPLDTDWAILPSGTVNYSAASGESTNMRGIRQTGGILNITGGELNLAQLASSISEVGSVVNHTGGFATINTLRVGDLSSGSYTVSGDGELRIGRARGDYSLYLGGGGSSSSGSFTVDGARFTTRGPIRLGNASSAGLGVFSILGSDGVVGVGSANDDIDGGWHQYSGSTLLLRFDIGGTSPIFIQDNSSTDVGTFATFESGSILDVDHLAGSGAGGGTWTVLEVENGDVVDNGLEFAAGVDTSVWSFSVDNSGVNGKLIVSAAGDPVGFDLIVGNARQQQMRFGMDYERLWFWTGGLNASERDAIAKWSAIDTRIDYIRVAINSAYELEEGNFNMSAYTNKILPLMQEMKDANPDIKFFASPRPLNEAVSGAAWQPYPRWVTGDPGNGNFDFDWQKCAEYLERYILLMKDNGFKISFMDLTNEWQSNDGSGDRMTQADARDITEYLKANLDPADMPLIIGPSAWNYSQGASWINNLDTNRRREAIDIAACHNTNRTGSAEQFADAVWDTLGIDTEIWNTEVHGWKTTSGENETTSFYFYLEKIRAGFSGLNGWLAIGTTNQGHAYILNPSGTPTRNVKYFIFRKLSETSNYGHALNLVEEPNQLSHTAALIRGNLMTVWVINQGTSAVPINVFPMGRTISESTVRRTRWTDPSDVEGFVTHEPVTDETTFWSSVPGESVCCFEILLDPEEYSYVVRQAEDEDERNGMFEEQSGDTDGTLNLGNINDDTWARYNNVTIPENSAMRFRVARPGNRRDGWVEVYLGSPGQSSASILAGKPVGKVAVPETGDWQVYETIEASLENAGGNYDVVLNFDEVGSDNNAGLFNLNWFQFVSPAPVVASTELNIGEGQRSSVESVSIRFDGDVDIASGAVSVVQRSTATAATFEPVTSSVTTQFVDGETIATVQFGSHVRNSDNALVDGNYQLTINASLVTQDGFAMAEDFVFGDLQSHGFYSYYGDSNGDRNINVIDLLSFRNTFNRFDGDPAYRASLDYNASGSVNVIDLIQFRNRFGKSIPFNFGSSIQTIQSEPGFGTP